LLISVCCCHIHFQIVDLTPGELEWLCNHLGHEVQIDKNFYRQHEAVVEIAKVGKLLMAVDAGKISQISGKKLSEITLDGWFALIV